MPLAMSAWGVCSVCTRALGYLKGCPQCGLPAVSQTLPCGRCLKKAPPWSALVAVDDYVLPLSRLVHQFKFSSQTALAQPLARLLLLAVLQARRTRGLPPVDTLVNVPLFQRRHWRRGYNQSDLLCPLAGLPVPRLCAETYSCHCRSAPAQRPVAQKEPEKRLSP